MPDYLQYSLSQFEKKINLSITLLPGVGSGRREEDKNIKYKKASSNNRTFYLTKGTIHIADSH